MLVRGCAEPINPLISHADSRSRSKLKVKGVSLLHIILDRTLDSVSHSAAGELAVLQTAVFSVCIKTIGHLNLNF